MQVQKYTKKSKVRRQIKEKKEGRLWFWIYKKTRNKKIFFIFFQH